MGFAISGGYAIAGIIIGVIGAGISTYAAYSQSQAQEKAAKQEASFRTVEAESIRQSAVYEETQQRRRLALLLGKQSAITAASGFDPTTGSPLLMELDSVRQSEMEALNIRRTGAVGATGREFEARLARQRAGYYGQSGGYAIAGGAVSAASSILGGWAASQGIGTRYGSYYNTKGGGSYP